MPIPVEIRDGKKTFTVLGIYLSSLNIFFPLPPSLNLSSLISPATNRSASENNPEVMNALATKLGLSKDLTFYDVYSLTDPDLISLIPRPVYALLVIIPLTPAWHESRIQEDAGKGEYAGSGPSGKYSPSFNLRRLFLSWI